MAWKTTRKYKNTPVYECEHCDMHYEEHRPRFCIQCKQEDFTHHASLGEFRRWRSLQLLEKGKYISRLRRQVRYPVKINGIKIFDYVADFDYYSRGKHIVEDFKGVKTATFRLKKKGFEAYYGKEITITTAG